MRLQEARILPDDVHNIGRDDGLVVLPALDLAQAQKVLDDGDQEALLLLLVYRRWSVNVVNVRSVG